MSSFDKSSLLDDSTAALLEVILQSFGIIVVVGFGAYIFSKLIKIKEAKDVVVSADNNVVKFSDVETPIIANFLQEFARERPLRFTSQQLHSFTNNYRKRLGSGGFGVVYKGELVSIAVKVLNRNLDKTARAQFMAEMGTIGKTYHKNLVRLFGFCYDHSMTAIVYEYLERGSLDKYLFGEKSQVLEWEKLHDIAVGTAKGITYLHEQCQQRIIHYDIKPANVLLDAMFLPKVADFGLAKLCNPENIHDSVTGYRGTPGYSAPEFLLKNHPITHKCDVYSFGMLLFEIVGRRRNAGGNCSNSFDWFPKHVWDEYEKGELAAVIVACGIEERDREKAERMSMVLWCVQESREARPPMSAVVKMLKGGGETISLLVFNRQRCAQTK